MRRFLKYTGLTLGALLVFVLIAITFVVATETGTRLVVSRALPQSVSVQSIDGRLIGPLVVRDLSFETPTIEVAVERAELRWQPRRLFFSALHVDRLVAEGVSVTSLPTDDEPPPKNGELLPPEISTPVAVSVQELSIRDAAYRSSPEATPVEIDAVRASFSASGATFDIERLEVSAPLFDAQAEARLVAREEYPIDAAVDLTLRPAGYATVNSTTRVEGSLQSLQITQTVAQPYNLEAEARLRDIFEQLHIEVGASLSDVDPAAISASLPHAVLDARLRAEGPASDLSLGTTITGTYGEQQFSAELQSVLQGDRLSVDTLAVALAEDDAQLEGSGSVQLAGNVPMDVSINWQNLQWPLGKAPDWRSESGTVTVAGSLDDYSLSSTASVTLPRGVPIQARVSGTGNREEVTAELDLSLFEGRVDGDAFVSWQPSLQASVRLDGQDVDPAAVVPDWPGRLDFSLRAQAEADRQETRAQVETLTIDGRLRGQPIDVDAEGSYADGELVLERLQAQLAGTRLSAEGRYADTADLTWELESDDLGEILPSARGTLSSRGSVSGSPPQVKVDATLDGSALGFRDNRLESLELVADLDLTDQQPSQLDLRLDGLETAALSADVVSLTVDGRLREHQVALMADTSQVTTDLEIEGRLQEPWSGEPTWQFTMADATVAYGELAPWRLGTSAEGSVSAAQVVLNRNCWASGSAKLCLEGQRTPDRLSGSFDLEELGLDYFAPLLPAGIELDGTLGGNGSGVLANGGPLRAELELQTSAGQLAVDAAPAGQEQSAASRTLLDLEPSRVSLTLDEDTATAAVSFDFAQGTIRFEADLAASRAPLMQRPLDGRAVVDVPDISFIEPFAPDIENLKGQVNGQLEIAGTPAQPDLSGRIALTDAALTSMAAGIRLEEIEAALQGRDNAGIGLEASMHSGGGSLEINGRLGLGAAPPPTTIEVDGESFQLIGNDEARLFVSPDLEVVADSEAVRITGTVRVPRAQITPEIVPQSAVKASEDVVLVSRNADPESAIDDAAGRPVYAEVEIALGEEVRFDGFGLKARFEGATTVIQTPDEPTTATGAITIAEGEYRAYGQGLVIESGEILFAGGPVTEPALDIRAVRRPEEGILVGTEVRGTLENPDFTLFSEPAMTQQERLAYLVLGRSLEEAPDGESSALAQASLALGVKGGNFLAENLGSRLGVDELSIETGSGEAGAASDPADAALVIGEYLSPKLYLSYGIGIFDPESVLTLEYEINRRLELVTETSSESTGADLIYSFERGD